MKKRIAIIGSGISGLSAAAYSAKAGHEVHVFEKNGTPGGRARQFKTENGYTFDMGPSWYWMPDIIDNFFSDFGYRASDFYELVKLDPQFEMIFADNTVALPGEYSQIGPLFESIEPGAGKRLASFMKSASYKYKVAMTDFVQKPCYSWFEFFSLKILRAALRLDLLSNFRSYVKKYFRDPRLIALMEFPVIFLGASPKNIPAMYSLMNYGGYALGTWYPMGGFYRLVEAMKTVGEKQGVHFHFNKGVDQIRSEGGKTVALRIGSEDLYFDAVIASSDYHHTETLLKPSERNYSDSYWKSRVFAPSTLIYYLGFNKKINRLKHHNLFFENDLDMHIDDIYKDKKWPRQPLFYACCPSKTDPDIAPPGHENIFLLIPIAIGLEDNEELRENYFRKMMERLESYTGEQNLTESIDYKKSFCVKDFITDYNAYGGNAYGLGNTLQQTAVLKPGIRNRKLANLYYTGQLTVPGPGIPPSIISGKIVANEVNINSHL